MKDELLDKVLSLFFDRKKRNVSLIFLLGVVLRILAARNIGVAADDANHAIRPLGIFGSGKLVIWDQSTALWYYIQGVFYKLFGLSQVTSRFASILFGSLMILLVFLFANKIFKSERTALMASLLVATSPILIKSTLPEMDLAVGFFTLFSAYFLFNFFESRKNKDIVLAGILMGVGVMVKIYALFFAFSFLIFFIYRETRSNKINKRTIRNVLILGSIVFLLAIPTLTHNYLLYREQGFMDLIFTNTLKFGEDKAREYYSWGAGWMPYTDYWGFLLGNQRNFDSTQVPGFLIVIGFLFRGDPILSTLGLCGLIYSFARKRDYFTFYLITFLPAFIVLGSQIPLAKHFIWSLILVSPMAGNFIEVLLKKIKGIKFVHLFLIIIIFNMLYLGMQRGVVHAHFYGESSFGQLVDFKKRIPETALVVVDSRIYRGNIHWGLAGTNFIEATDFFDIAEKVNRQGNLQKIQVYYIECVIDDCGWGTIDGQPEFNRSMEDVTKFFNNASFYREDFDAPDPDYYYLPLIGRKRVDYRVYKTELNINPIILDVVEQTHVWYLYPERYDRTISPIFDDFTADGLFEVFVYRLAWAIFYFEIFVSFTAILYLVYLFLYDEAFDNNSGV